MEGGINELCIIEVSREGRSFESKLWEGGCELLSV